MMVADSEDGSAGKLPMEIGELGLGVTNLENIVDIDCVHTTNCKAMPKETKNSQTGGSCFKRVWQVDDEQTSVQIIFKSLSRKSKKKLEELLHQWSEWHAQQGSLSEGSDEELESGEETYFPALHVNTDKSCPIFFYMDNQVKKKQRTEDAPFNKGFVPIYDRDFAFALTSGDGLANKESVMDILNASRCFNCDAYDHSLKECPKPFNKVVVNNARKMHQLKSKWSAGPRVLTRYYQDTPGGKFDGLRPGCLDSETRKLLGLAEFDPPPWLNRMREMGYPPGYLDLEDEDQPSGIIIYGNGDTKEENEECFNVNSTEPKRKISVDFPGINAPIPVNADRSRWTTLDFQPTGFNSCSDNSLLNHRIESSPELYFRGHSHNPSWWPDCRRESSPFISDYARSYQDYAPGVSLLSDYARSYQNSAPGVPLLSNYANKYWDHINQPSYSSNAYQNSWSSFHG